jgi:PAS domain S-box-containing protein
MASTKLLYIEDDPEQRESLAESLRERGFEVETAASGKEGLAALDPDEHHLVVSDLNMPGMDGLAVLAAVQKLAPDLPFVLLTAHPSIPLAVQAIMEGAQRFLIKPVAIDEMELTIHQALEYARLRRWQRQSEEQLTRLVETAPVPYIITRMSNGEVLYANRHLAELVGLPPETIKGRPAADFYYDPDQRRQVIERLQKDHFIKDVEVRVRKADGTPVWAMFSLAEAEIGGEKVVLGGFLDITRRKQLEEKLRIYHEVFIHSVDVITVIDKEGRIIERNPAHQQRTGWTDDDVAKRTVFEFLGADKAQEIKNAVAATGSYRGEAEAISKTGAIVPIDISIFPIHDAQGELDLYVGMGRDITRIKKALNELADTNRELREAQGQLVQSEKMASLGSLVAGIAHEINTPVGAMTSMHDTLVRAIEKLKEHLASKDREAFEQDSKLQKLLGVVDESNQVIRSGASRVGEIVRRLRSFARLDEAELKTVNIHDGLEDTLMLVHHEIKHHIELVKDYGDVPPLSVYPSRLNQVFLNLLNNARQAIGEKGTITIRTAVEGGQAVIEFTDDGVGIAPGDLKKVFDPGFTTKGVGVGTGLGLSICYQIIQDHRGSIDVHSSPGHGATFTIRLPLNLDEILGIS